MQMKQADERRGLPHLAHPLATSPADQWPGEREEPTESGDAVHCISAATGSSTGMSVSVGMARGTACCRIRAGGKC